MAERGTVGVAVGGAVLIGALTALQARINGTLGAEIGDGFVAAAVSFSSGLVILVVLSALIPGGRRGFGRLVAGIRTRTIPPWMLLGGLVGAFTVASQGLTVATIGVALFTVGFVAGQTTGGMVLDRIGYGPAGVVPVTVRRLVGALLAIAGVVVCLSGDALGGVPLWMLVVPAIAGAGVAWQQGTNGRLRVRVESPLTATLVNFIGGTVVLVIAAGVHVGLVGAPRTIPTEPWLYLGGAVGVIYIFLSSVVVRRTGVLLLGLGSVVGLLTTSVLLDALWPAPAAPSTPVALLAAAVAIAGVAVAAVPWRRRRR
ncbi:MULTISPECIES: DMT family transporter [Microbacterium]|uniref:Transporter family-2 protein n=1 Tax=Microbacterium testaceum (strain StLB037) TaxID=979556 RepID=A0A1H0RN26_MICTS|nr:MULTISPECIES: DMT family transporter [Microbacterium]MCY1717929.1 DMT family transporter [Microbacterium sp. SL62]SDP30923.1 transporter family-2 protein [Microbacterium testaceum StLB037]